MSPIFPPSPTVRVSYPLSRSNSSKESFITWRTANRRQLRTHGVYSGGRTGNDKTPRRRTTSWLCVKQPWWTVIFRGQVKYKNINIYSLDCSWFFSSLDLMWTKKAKLNLTFCWSSKHPPVAFTPKTVIWIKRRSRARPVSISLNVLLTLINIHFNYIFFGSDQTNNVLWLFLEKINVWQKPDVLVHIWQHLRDIFYTLYTYSQTKVLKAADTAHTHTNTHTSAAKCLPLIKSRSWL